MIYPYENQPWEKMIILAAAERGVKTIGYQHGGGMPRFMLSYFHGVGEAEREPLPDVIITSGLHSHRVLSEGGTPMSRLVMGGSWRFRHLAAEASLSNGSRVDVAPVARVLVSLPVTRVMGRHLLAAVKKAFPDGGKADGLRFLIKPHPACPIDDRRLGFDAEIVNGTLSDAISTCGVVLYTGSSAGMEAMIAGRRVLRYRSELLLNIDHGDMFDDDEVPTCGDDDLRCGLLGVAQTLRQQQVLTPYDGDLLGNVFAPVDESVWLKTFRGLLSGEVGARAMPGSDVSTSCVTRIAPSA